MKIEKQKYNDILVLQLQGEFTSDAIKSFDDATADVISTEVSGIVLDMSKVVLLDSESLEKMTWFNEYCRENTRPLKLAGLDENCHSILEITRLLPQFDSYTEMAEAVKSFA